MEGENHVLNKKRLNIKYFRLIGTAKTSDTLGGALSTPAH